MTTDWWEYHCFGRRMLATNPRRTDGKIDCVTNEQQTAWAKSVDARKPTVAEFTQMWLQCGRPIVVRGNPFPRAGVTPHVWLTDYVGSEDGTPYVVAKTWVDSPRESSVKAVNYGLFVPHNECRNQGQWWFWLGIKAYTTDSPEWRALQSEADEHGHTHTDWSQACYATKEVDTGEKERSPWRDPSKSHGERIVAWMEHELAQGVRETIPNWSPRIAEYLEPCMRNGINIGKGLAKTGAEWCASFRCYGEKAAELPRDVPTGFGYRCSGIELEQDAKKAGAWVDIEKQRVGGWMPHPGDIAIFKRGTEGWQRHVSTVVRPGEKSFETIDGNKSNRVSRMSYSYSDPNLLGFCPMPRPNERMRITDHLLRRMTLP